MSGDFDPTDPSVEIPWLEAMTGLFDGNLEPLAAYIRAGNPVVGDLAMALATAIEGRGLVRVRAERLNQDRQPVSKVLRKVVRRTAIGIEFERRRRADPDLKAESIVSSIQAIEEFWDPNGEPPGRSYVYEAHGLVKRCLNDDLEEMIFGDYVRAAVGNAFP